MKLIALADLHLSENTPPCRPDGEDLIATQARKLNFVADLALQEDVDYILIAGDLFDSWRTNSTEFLTLCTKWLTHLRDSTKSKQLITIPGNHDSLGGDIGELKRSPYALLVAAGVLTDVQEDYEAFSSYLYTDDCKKEHSNPIVLAHKGLWYKEKPFIKASDDGNIKAFINKLAPECRLLIAGDYHKDFAVKLNGIVIVNCGSLTRMRADQIDYKPKVRVITYGDAVSVQTVDIPLTCEIRRDYIDNNQRPEVDLLGNIDGTFEIECDFEANFKELIKTDEDKDELLKRFELMRNGND